MKQIPFNRPYTTGHEIDYIREAVSCSHLSSGGSSQSAAKSGWSRPSDAAGRC